MGTNSGESDVRYLEAERVGSRVESTGVCVKLKTVTDIYSRQCLSCTEFLASWQHLHGVSNVFAALIY